jgi:hypothetical protein
VKGLEMADSWIADLSLFLEEAGDRYIRKFEKHKGHSEGYQGK